MWILRTLMLLTLIVWIGGIIFFAFVVAPALFSVLPTTQMAGDVVSVSLSRLHYIGLAAGAVFLICSLIYNRLRYAQLKIFSGSHVLIVLMLLLTAISQFAVTPRMREIRSSPAALESYSVREEFDRLHLWSTRLESGVLLLGLGLVVVTSRRFGSPGL
jgi:uncharacterized membrane protein